MDYGHLTCNFKNCYKVLNDFAFITFCSHIFCQNHGEFYNWNIFNLVQISFKKKHTIFLGNEIKTTLLCPVCKHVLSDHQVLENNLNASVESKKVTSDFANKCEDKRI